MCFKNKNGHSKILIFLFFILNSFAFSKDCTDWLYKLQIAGPSYNLHWISHPLKSNPLGDHVKVQLSKNGETRIVEGSIVSEPIAGFTMIDNKTGELISVHAQDNPKPIIISSISHPHHWENETMPDKIFETIRKYKNPYAFINDKWHFKFMLFGKISEELDTAGNRIITIRDKNGIVHKLDPDIVKIDVHFTEGKEGINDLFPEVNKDHIVKLSTQNIRHEKVFEWFVNRKTHFRSKEFYEHFSHLSIEELRALLAKLYNGYLKAEEIDHFTKSLGLQHATLLLDPGIACRIPKIIEFAKSKIFRDPWSLRQAFEDSLGNTTLYRGLYLDNFSLKKILSDGLSAPGFNIPGFPKLYMRLLFKNASYDGPPLDFESSYGREIWQMSIANQKNPIYRMNSSYSHYPEIAESVTVQSNRSLIPEGLGLYMFEVRMPELSTIRLEGPFDFKLLPNIDEKLTHICVAKNCYNIYTDRNIEVFVPFHTEASRIVKFRKIQGTPLEFSLREEKDI